MPASYDFSWSGDGKPWRTLKRGADGTLLSTKRSGGFVGAVFGLYAHGEPAKAQIAITIDDFRSMRPIRRRPRSRGQRPHGRGAEGGGCAGDGLRQRGSCRRKQGTVETLRGWRKAGFTIGNHGWSHPHLSALTIAQFEQELVKNEPLLEKPGGASDWRWFRYPSWMRAKMSAQRTAARAVLAKHNYRIAGVTMGFSDWAWTEPYARCLAKHDSAAVRSSSGSIFRRPARMPTR